MADCEKCLNEQRIMALESDSVRNSAQHKEFYSRFEQSAVNHAITETNYGTIISTLSEIKADVSELKNKPNKRWESIIGAGIGAVVSALVTMLIVKGGF